MAGEYDLEAKSLLIQTTKDLCWMVVTDPLQDKLNPNIQIPIGTEVRVLEYKDQCVHFTNAADHNFGMVHVTAFDNLEQNLKTLVQSQNPKQATNPVSAANEELVIELPESDIEDDRNIVRADVTERSTNDIEHPRGENGVQDLDETLVQLNLDNPTSDINSQKIRSQEAVSSTPKPTIAKPIKRHEPDSTLLTKGLTYKRAL